MVNDPIRHIIVLMLENRSFDHMLGGLADELGLEGIPSGQSRRFNKDFEGHPYDQVEGAERVLKYDPHHEYEHVFHQLANHNSGFVDDFSRSYPHSTPEDRWEIMKYHKAGDLPALHTLARHFTVCDHWFSSVPGPTWTNRFFVHSGTSLGRVAMPNGILDANLHWYDQPTVYDRLNERGQAWKIYYGDIPQSLMLVDQLEPINAARYFKMRSFFEDVSGDEKSFPQYAFIEPTYYPPGANDDHPPHDVLEGERLIADVYNSIRANEELWMSSLLVVLWDEHGGLYDHVEPPFATQPDNRQEEFTFDRLGVRVPAVLVSPWVPKQVLGMQFDHTSLLKYVQVKWKLQGLGDRVLKANSFQPVFLSEPRKDAPREIPGPAPSAGLAPHPDPLILGRRQPAMSSQQSALFAMTQLLESATQIAEGALASRVKRIVTGLDGQVDVALERLEAFLHQHRTQA